MDDSLHTIHNLFAQLGLPSSEPEIQAFIERYRPLEPNMVLSEAPFWTDSQAKFLKEQIIKDADWAPVIDSLNASLR